MAEEGFFSKFFKEALNDLPVDLLFMTIFHWVMGKRKEGKDAPAIDVRGELLGDLSAVEEKHGKMENIWRHRGEWAAKKLENRFWMLLAKIPREAEVRETVFTSLNAMGDDEFAAAMEELNNDAVWQFCQRVTMHASPAFQKAWEAVKQADQLRRQAGDRFHGWTEAVEQARSDELSARAHRGCLWMVLWGLSIPIFLIAIFFLIVWYTQ